MFEVNRIFAMDGIVFLGADESVFVERIDGGFIPNLVNMVRASIDASQQALPSVCSRVAKCA